MENLPEFDVPGSRPAETPHGVPTTVPSEPAGSPSNPGALGALEDGLAGAIPGLRILDRELEFAMPTESGRGRIDLAGVDGEGRVVLVALLEDGSGDAAALAALDLLALAHAHGPLLARHLEVAETTGLAGGARCVLVAEDFGPLLLSRLAPFRDRIDLLRLCTLRSARGTRTYLVTVEDEGRAVVPPLPARCSREDFLEPLAPEPRRLVELLLERMQRMDSEFDLRFTHESADWAFHGRDFLTLELGDEGLIGRVLPGGSAQTLDGERAVERLVEQAFGTYVRLLGLFDEAETAYEPGGGGPAGDPGSVLTAEEIAAFQA